MRPWRMFSYPELLFIALVNIAPLAIAAVWTYEWHCCNPWGFLGRWVFSMLVGFGLWLAIILLIVWPRFRH